ncbi:ETS-related transcription factor Elf-1-like [Ylistrum balloti]|uniref:ETS-related transcription factor Elf-1-like n=1 Tax=Ylistrum balloti TaxID=509963 RepID=UPI002905CD41|nr:ETS-related transcription factor Elf-1-like [Ylistrum balloti]
MGDRIRTSPDQKHSYVELKQVPLDVYGERLSGISSASACHRKQWRKIQPAQQECFVQASDICFGIKEEPGIEQQVKGRFQSLSGQDAGYLYPVEDSRSSFQSQNSPDIPMDHCHLERSPVYTDTTNDLFHNLESMKVISENGEVSVELYGYQYPIDISDTMDINGGHKAEYNKVDYPIQQSPSKSEPHLFSINDTQYSDPYTNKRTKTKDAVKARYRQKRMQRGCRLWEFIRDLLQNPLYNPSHIKWIDRSVGEFRLVKSNQIARMWGAKKNNECMTYEKLSRAMRYYYKREILSPVLGKRLVYRFGAKSYGW